MADEQSDLEKLAALDGAEVERTDDGEIRLVRMPPEYTGSELHPSQVEGYEPRFERTGLHRRVLGHVTDEVGIEASLSAKAALGASDDQLGPRNTPEAIAFWMGRDAFSPGIGQDNDAVGRVQAILDALEEAKLVEQRQGGSYKLTAAGRTELMN